jgi:hypothetical protein
MDCFVASAPRNDVETVPQDRLSRSRNPSCSLRSMAIAREAGHAQPLTLHPCYALYADAGRCARRKDRIWRTANGIRSLGSFHGNMLASAFGASIAVSMATA